MKFITTVVALVASAMAVDAFVPAAPAFTSVASRSSAGVQFLDSEISTQSSSTALNMGLNPFRSRNKAESESDATEEEIRALFYLWNDALATGDSRIVAKRYAAEPVLLPTVSDTPRRDFASIKDYFDAFLLKKPQGKIVDGNIKIGKDWAQDTGIYEFTMGVDGTKVKGRYTFVYVFEDGQWKIAQHHSSVMPEGIPKAAQPITEKEVKNLFYLWNDALATLDAKTVAARYSKEAVLLPTVSDVPRTNDALIVDYFEGFLKKQPQGEILESNVMIGTNWAQDAGIYEFTMGVDGSKVKGRYSFVYVFEDGEWKISHHHSSVMPEAFLGAAPKPAVKADKAVEA